MEIRCGVAVVNINDVSVRILIMFNNNSVAARLAMNEIECYH